MRGRVGANGGASAVTSSVVSKRRQISRHDHGRRGFAPVDWGIDLCNQVLRGYLLGARDFMETPSQVGGDSRRVLSRS
jgi:hypothetical protein